MISSWKNTRFDNIAFTSGENFTHSFPDHFHEEYTIGVSVNGIQQFNLLNKEFIVAPHSIFLIKPGQMHAHHPIADLGWSFKSMYLSPDFVDHLLKGSEIKADSAFVPVVQDEELFNHYINIHENKESDVEDRITSFLYSVYQRSTDNSLQASVISSSEKLDEIKAYLADHITQKLNLDTIAGKFHIDKFQLIRQFKKHTGVTPNVYLTILRVECARRLMNQNHSLVETAFEAGFYDQSHFHHNFLYYTGVTPGSFVG
ncbi:AraC family transcriptional regulator [Mucilaginibacter jinjuensis]|uniref:AraC family transcriptional regulator n=1 Tax=Mucilaginibacter jinjuensis TaxID=1176721 RepID=A0ABY7TC05_9SPHI|nr:AraC family transcriptional regulator [Mucilaginibacter jinjuensis]WCT13892.1 AraC family transcriptional regulator [Mucilaginibacter jinjuensis]